MFRLKRMSIDTPSEDVAFVHQDAVAAGGLGLEPLDRVLVGGTDAPGAAHEITAVLNFCSDALVSPEEIGLVVDGACTEARGPIGFGIGPRLEALDVLAVLRRDPAAPRDLREKSLFLAARILELVGAAGAGGGYRAAQETLHSGRAESASERIASAQGRRELPPEAPCRSVVCAAQDGRVRAIDCWRTGRVAKQAGAPVHPSAGVRWLASAGDVVERGAPLFEIHAQSPAQLELARRTAERAGGGVEYGF